MDDGKLKRTLQRCSEGPFYPTDLSIGHRGAALQFPEYTQEPYEVAARMGAGILERGGTRPLS
jgi:glycerophosphoryl diester phosphodiesterase